jgi:Fic family protein
MGDRDDRMMSQVTVSLPPIIAHRTTPIDSELAAAMENAVREIVALDAGEGASLEALGVLLIRTESVASSKIENIDASMDDYARASHGIKSNASAVAMVAATDALDSMIDIVNRTGRIELDTLTSAHAALMAEEPSDRGYAGRLRDMQNWIGGSDHSPYGAMYVPPPPETVPGYMADLIDFANRDNLPVLTQCAIAHAQFESIHPFTDGNGRIGRGLINSILRRRGVTTRTVVPLASALVAHRDRYFDQLAAYRDGDPRPLTAGFAEASRIAAAESRVTARRLDEIPGQWQADTGTVRADSAASRLLALLPIRPIMSVEQMTEAVGGAPAAVYNAVEQLAQAGVLRALTDRKRNQVWGAAAILDELNGLGNRITAAAR